MAKLSSEEAARNRNRGSMFISINKKRHAVRVADDDDDRLVLEVETHGEVTCGQAIENDFMEMGFGSDEATRWAEHYSEKIVRRGIIETLFE